MHRSKLTSKTAKTEKRSTALFLGAMTSLPKAGEKSFFRFVDKNPLFSDNDPCSVLKSIVGSRKTHIRFVEHVGEGYDFSSDALRIPCVLETDD